MKKLRLLVVFGSLIFVMSCASQPKAVPQEDPHLGQLQGQVDDLRRQVAVNHAAIAQLQSPMTKLTMPDQTSNDSVATKDESIGKMQAELDSQNAQVLASKQSDATLQKKINELTKTNKALEIASQKDAQDAAARIAVLKSLFSKEIARGDLDIRKYRNILIVSVKDSVLFLPDSRKLRPKMGSLLKKLAEVFKEDPSRIVRIEGNTAVAASSPESLRFYPTSWHLGAARAATVAQFLQEQCGMNPMQLVATSLGEFRPRADNSTEAGKAQNRRVDFILIARSLYEINQLQTVVQ